ncbi:MAG: acetamidase/formamidase family protein [Deltaproteobacteria bacterium]|nr:acetamidase/formamidase family protein [Deltaproteobacteria bacterium]
MRPPHAPAASPSHVPVSTRAAASLFACALLASCAAHAAPTPGPATESGPLTGRWVVTTEQFGIPRYFVMTLVQSGTKLTGDFDGDTLEGTFDKGAFSFHAKDTRGGYEDGKGTLKGGALTGSIVLYFSNDVVTPVSSALTATRVQRRASATPQRHEFTPSVFHRQFSPLNKPVLTIFPGDTLHTTTVDAGGFDETGVQRSAGGNPQTGPFYVEGVMPGDTLVVHIDKLATNRDYAISDDGLVPRAMSPDTALMAKDLGADLRWHLDAKTGLATSGKPGPHTASYTVPLKPMLGCIATATPPGRAPPQTQDSGEYGGNLDFNEITQGATVFLPVRNPGALLYFGDGHAAQGDGELNGNALETSLDVEVTVDVIPGKQPQGVRVENETHVMSLGYAGSLDDAFREATENMAGWLKDEYKLTPSEVAQVLGTAAEYKVTEVADRNAGVVLTVNRERLKTVTKVVEAPKADAPKPPGAP